MSTTNEPERERCFVCGSIQGTHRFAITVDGDALNFGAALRNLAPYLCNEHGARYLLRAGIVVATLGLTDGELAVKYAALAAR